MVQDNNVTYLLDKQLASAYDRIFLDFIDQDVSITAALQKCGPEFDIAVDDLFDSLSTMRTCLDNLMIVMIGDPSIPSEIEFQLRRAFSLHHSMMSECEEFACFVQKNSKYCISRKKRTCSKIGKDREIISPLYSIKKSKPGGISMHGLLYSFACLSTKNKNK